MNKMKVGIIFAVIIAAMALTPIAIYGTEVDIAQVSFGLSVNGPLQTTSLSNMQPPQIPSFGAGINNVAVNVSSMNTYEYMLARNTARAQMSGEDNQGETLVEITILFNLTTPNNNSIIFELTPGSDQGTGDRNIVLLLGPDDGLTMEGEFHLSITITVKVTPSGFSEPVVDITLNPVNLSFTIPTRS